MPSCSRIRPFPRSRRLLLGRNVRHRGHFLSLTQLHHPHALRVAAHHRNLRHRNAIEYSAGGPDQDLIIVVHSTHADDRSRLLGNLHVDHAHAAAALDGILSHWGTLAQTQLRHREQAPSLLGIGHAYHGVTGSEPDPPHATGAAAHLANLPGLEANRFALLRGQYDLRLFRNQFDADEAVRALQRDGKDAGALGVDEFHQAGALDDTALGHHEDTTRIFE